MTTIRVSQYLLTCPKLLDLLKPSVLDEVKKPLIVFSHDQGML